MQDITYYTSRLRALSNEKIAKKRQKEIRGIKGVRGVSNSDLIGVINEGDWPVLPQDEETVHRLYGTAHEDGLLAIALLAVCALEQPNAALQLVDRWLPFLDDTETADFLGHLVIGPAALATDEPIALRLQQAANPYAVRAELMGVLAALPIPVIGVCVAGLRRKFAVEQVIFVEEPILERVQQAVQETMYSDSPLVRKALRTVIRHWATWDPRGSEDFFVKEYPNWPNWMKESWRKGCKIGRKRMP